MRGPSRVAGFPIFPSKRIFRGSFSYSLLRRSPVILDSRRLTWQDARQSSICFPITKEVFMRPSKLRILAVLIALVAFAGSTLADEKKAAPAKAKAAGKAVMWSPDELKWIDPPNSPPGVKIAVLWGDPQKGPHGAFHKFTAGFEA